MREDGMERWIEEGDATASAWQYFTHLCFAHTRIRPATAARAFLVLLVVVVVVVVVEANASRINQLTPPFLRLEYHRLHHLYVVFQALEKSNAVSL